MNVETFQNFCTVYWYLVLPLAFFGTVVIIALLISSFFVAKDEADRIEAIDYINLNRLDS